MWWQMEPEPVEVPFTRAFVDDEGRHWQVSEIDGSQVPAARGARCLVFRSSQAIRRVWNYPSEWSSMDGEELLRISWNR